MSELVESALRQALNRTKPVVKMPPLPSFSSGGSRVDVFDRDALFNAMGRQHVRGRYERADLNVVFDVHTAVLMRENGVRTIYTNDADFKRFPFIDVVDPAGKQVCETAEPWAMAARKPALLIGQPKGNA